MWISGHTYLEASAFVLGCDAGNDFTLLSGFHEWLAVRLNGYENLHWSAQVLQAAFPERAVAAEDIVGSPEMNRKAIDSLVDLLVDFFRERESNGLPSIFEQYFSWVTERGPI